MAKFQFFQNSNRYDQNVGKVLISRKMALKNYKHPFWTKISLIFIILAFLGSKGRPPIGPYLANILFLHTPVLHHADVSPSDRHNENIDKILICEPGRRKGIKMCNKPFTI